MVLAQGDLKFYHSDENGDIDLNNEYDGSPNLFSRTMNISNDQEKKIWIKNTNESSTSVLTKFYIVNGLIVNNTHNTPIVAALTEVFCNIAAGIYSFIFPSVNSAIVTGPNNIPRPAQNIICDDTTSCGVYLLENLPIFTPFDADLSTADTATITVTPGAEYLYVAPDVSGVPGTYASRNNYNDGLDIGTNGTLGPGESVAVWIKQSIPSTVSNLNTIDFVPLCTGCNA